MQCDDVAKLLPAAVEHGAAVEISVQRHIESCLRCQAELARYRRMLRGLQLLRTRYLEPSPGLLAQTLAAIEEAGERQAVHSILSGRRLAYVGAIGGAAFAATAATAAMIVHRSRRRGVRSPADVAPTGGLDRVRLRSSGSPHRSSEPVRRPGIRLGRPRTPLLSSLFRPDQNGRRAVAQLVEHRSPKPAVAGSSPSCPAVNTNRTAVPCR